MEEKKYVCRKNRNSGVTEAGYMRRSRCEEDLPRTADALQKQTVVPQQKSHKVRIMSGRWAIRAFWSLCYAEAVVTMRRLPCKEAVLRRGESFAIDHGIVHIRNGAYPHIKLERHMRLGA
jgi:hypothetical protein